jgi:hypothetical protein
MPKVKNDSTFGLAILEEFTTSKEAKDALIKVASAMGERIIKPMLEHYMQGLPLTAEEIKVFNYLSAEHTSGKQWGGLFPEMTQQELTALPDYQQVILESILRRFNPAYIEGIDKKDDFAGVMKCIADVGFCYVEYLGSQHTSKFTSIKNGIFPTAEELDARIPRTEMGQAPHIATTFGIGTVPEHDISPLSKSVPVGAERAHQAGKGFFGGVDSQIRATIVARKYDETILQWERLEQKISVETDETVLLDLTKQRATLQPNLIALTQKMSLYHIPLKASERSESIVDHDIPKSSIEKLARWGGSDNEPLPLIASASGTTARALITAQDLNLFQTADGIDLKMAQYLASSFCA